MDEILKRSHSNVCCYSISCGAVYYAIVHGFNFCRLASCRFFSSRILDVAKNRKWRDASGDATSRD